MREIRDILIALGFVAKEACASAVVRKHPSSGLVAADGSIEISTGFGGKSAPKLSPNIVRKATDWQSTMDGNIEIPTVLDSSAPMVRKVVQGHVNAEGSIEISAVSVPQVIPSPVRKATDGHATMYGNIVSKSVFYNSTLEPSNIVTQTTDGQITANGKMTMYGGTVTKNDLVNSTPQLSPSPLRKATEGELNETVRTTLPLTQGGLSKPLSRSEKQTRRIPFAVGRRQTLVALHLSRVQHPLVTLFVLTLIFVVTGSIFAAFYPNHMRGMTDQMIAWNRGLFQESTRSQARTIRKPKPFADNDFFRNYEIGVKLSEGAFGVVHAVRREGKTYAAKMIDIMDTDVDLIKEEVAILKRVQHPTLTACCLYEYHDQCFYYLVMPLYGGGDLSGAVSDYIESEGLLPEPLFARLFEQMANGVAFIHSKQVVHRDIKPENFLLVSSKLSDPRNRVVVADFGLSTTLENGGFLEEICGTPIFWSPELFKSRYDFKVDVFALGLSAYVLLVGAFAFKTEKEIKTWAENSDPPPMPPSISPDAQAIIEKTLRRNALHRVSAQELQKLATKLRSNSMEDNTMCKRISMEPAHGGAGYRTMGVSGGEIMKNKAERRGRMLWDLIMENCAKTMDKFDGGANVAADVLAARPFKIKRGRRNRKVSRYEFWSQEDCLKKHVSGVKDKDMEPLAQVTEIQSSDVQLLDDVLVKYSVDRSTWGQGKSKSTADLAKECKEGICFLTESEKMLERVVEIVVLVVRNADNKILHQLPLKPKAALGKASQRLGEKRGTLLSAFTDPRLPAKKMEPWETVREATDRILDMLNMKPEDLDLTFDVPMRVVRETSTSYPGLMTVYKKHMVEAFLLEEDCSPHSLRQWGLPGSLNFVVKTKEGCSNYGWLSEEEAELMGTVNEGEEGLAMRYAEVLPVKTKVISGDKIKDMLRKTRAKVDDMSDTALEELAEQISTGEVELVEAEQPDGTRCLKRKVTVTMLRLAHRDGSILLEVSKSVDGGATWQNKNWLPASKQHTFENPYYVARRLLTSRFMVAQGCWRMDKDSGGSIIEECESDQLPGLPTIYTKNIVAARLFLHCGKRLVSDRPNVFLS